MREEAALKAWNYGTNLVKTFWCRKTTGSGKRQKLQTGITGRWAADPEKTCNGEPDPEYGTETRHIRLG